MKMYTNCINKKGLEVFLLSWRTCFNNSVGNQTNFKKRGKILKRKAMKFIGMICLLILNTQIIIMMKVAVLSSMIMLMFVNEARLKFSLRIMKRRHAYTCLQSNSQIWENGHIVVITFSVQSFYPLKDY